MFEKKDREIKELQANVSMLETCVVKLEQQIEQPCILPAHEWKNILIMAGIIYLQHSTQRTASSLCENKLENTYA